MDVIIAARLSQKKGWSQTSIESQDEDAREWAKENGHNVVETVADYASGTKAMWQRPNLRAWVTDEHLMERYQGIIAAKQDRLSRADWRDEEDLRRWAEDNHKVLMIVDKDLRWPPRDDDRYHDDVSAWRRGAEDAHREWTNTSLRYKRMHRNLTGNNHLNTRPPYGYRPVPVEGTDHKTLAVYEPEAKVIREAVRRYLAGDTLAAIAGDLGWYVATLAKRLRSPAIAGRRGDLSYPAIIDWTTHQALVARLDSRANRKGVSPANNVYMLAGLLTDEAGHPMYGFATTNIRGQSYRYYRCRKGCGQMVRIGWAHAGAERLITQVYGDAPHRIRKSKPASSNFNKISRLRDERKELDEMADDFDKRNAALVSEIRRLAAEERDNPRREEYEWVDSGETIAQHWVRLATAAERRDWLKEHGWEFSAWKRDGQWHFGIPYREPVEGQE